MQLTINHSSPPHTENHLQFYSIPYVWIVAYRKVLKLIAALAQTLWSQCVFSHDIHVKCFYSCCLTDIIIIIINSSHISEWWKVLDNRLPYIAAWMRAPEVCTMMSLTTYPIAWQRTTHSFSVFSLKIFLEFAVMSFAHITHITTYSNEYNSNESS